MLRTVIATERDGFNVRTLTIQFDVPSKDFDLLDAVRKASVDFCKTEKGRAVFEYNCGCFNWGDFESNVPQELCEKHGFRKVEAVFCKTEKGRTVFKYNCGCFNWADFKSNVPQEFCEKHGFREIDTVLSNIEVNWDEQLVDEDDLEDDEDL